MSGQPLEPHVPVMLREVLEFLRPADGGVYLDGTVGAGGHAAALLEASSPSGRLVGIDQDPGALTLAGARLAPFAGRFQLHRGNFARLPEGALASAPFDGLLLDLGASSMHFDDGARGFSFSRDGPLDMRMDPEGSATAADLVNELPFEELRRILFEFGGERHASRVARRICERRSRNPLKGTAELADIVAGAVPRRGRIHPATRTFQALRIAVNSELENLDAFLEKLPGLLKKGGRAAVLSFHSLEDGRVKRAAREGARAGTWAVLTKKPLTPQRSEAQANPRARSAKLRVVERL